ncbi:MAG: exodeoxyribonuclease VII small subunit [Alphaproteobacteria bacterium]|jgi:exodeoxyribonuclease VII small subunit|nr:exodeoxyribonuclease VII small subunit [Pseudomonadota bacterium]MCZ6467388.1 exodeoxyribonuclease VII small subunit [Alphaproteobacteria bacterium]MCZ6607357.1 exodeoxyribonuclease VII small subunit [Alphaproteobacteria bacterium]
MADDKLPPDIARLSFEDALSELETIVRQLEDGKGELDQAIKTYERGAQLKRHCEAKLQEAQIKVEKVVLGPQGAVGVEPADAD